MNAARRFMSASALVTGNAGRTSGRAFAWLADWGSTGNSASGMSQKSFCGSMASK
jgi:hypothetical protein